VLNEDQFLKGMAVLMSAYPDYKCTPETVDVYRVALRNLSPQDFERAVWAHITTLKWFPKVSELLDAIRDQGPTPIDIWNRLLAAAETGKKPEMDAATKKALAVLGGWDQFQYTSYDDLQYRFKDFKTALLEARARDTLALAGGERAALPGPEE
jgi:hypothetical protein